MGCSERTVHRCLSSYREGGMEELLWEAEPQRRPKKVSVEEVAMIQNELKDPEGFSSYKEIHFWTLVVQEIKASYMTIYRVVKEELKAKLKVARPVSPKQLPGEVEAFKNNLVTELKNLQEKESDIAVAKSIGRRL